MKVDDCRKLVCIIPSEARAAITNSAVVAYTFRFVWHIIFNTISQSNLYLTFVILNIYCSHHQLK